MLSRTWAAWWFFPQCMEQGGPCMAPCTRGWWLHPLHTGRAVNSTPGCSASFWLGMEPGLPHRQELVPGPCETTGLVFPGGVQALLRWVTLLPTVTSCRGWPRHSAAIPTLSCTPSTLLATSWKTEVLRFWAGMSLHPQKLMFNFRSHQQLPPVQEAAAQGGMDAQLCWHSHSELSALIRGHCLQPARGEEFQGSAEPQLG